MHRYRIIITIDIIADNGSNLSPIMAAMEVIITTTIIITIVTKLIIISYGCTSSINHSRRTIFVIGSTIVISFVECISQTLQYRGK